MIQSVHASPVFPPQPGHFNEDAHRTWADLIATHREHQLHPMFMRGLHALGMDTDTSLRSTR